MHSSILFSFLQAALIWNCAGIAFFSQAVGMSMFSNQPLDPTDLGHFARVNCHSALKPLLVCKGKSKIQKGLIDKYSTCLREWAMYIHTLYIVIHVRRSSSFKLQRSMSSSVDNLINLLSRRNWSVIYMIATTNNNNSP